ncbi:hypothetical protein NPN16_23470, partial [Vibrio parahaemolyticus]|uniref:hypothetical protein n=1 Tax=Vibrio parahaemolyticus TaxID=670 RepID=UPI002111AFBB
MLLLATADSRLTLVARVLVGDGDNLVEKNVDIERAALAAKEEFAEIKIAENAGASEFVGDRVVIAALQCVAVAAN